MKIIKKILSAALLLALMMTICSCDKQEDIQASSESTPTAETITDKSAPTYSKEEMIEKIKAAGYTNEMLNYDYPEGENEEGILISLMYANEAFDDAITAFCFATDEYAEAGLKSSASTAEEGKVCSLYGRWVIICNREFADSVK